MENSEKQYVFRVKDGVFYLKNRCSGAIWTAKTMFRSAFTYGFIDDLYKEAIETGVIDTMFSAFSEDLGGDSGEGQERSVNEQKNGGIP